MDVEDKRKRLYFALCALVGGVTMAFFGAVDIVSGRAAQGVLIVAAASMLMASIVVLRFFNDGRPVYRFCTALLLVLFSYHLAFGRGEGPFYLYFYVFPIAFFFMLDRREGLLWVVGSIILATLILLSQGLFGTNTYGPDIIVPFLVNYCMVCVFSFGLESSRARFYRELLQEKEAMEQASGEIRVLSGLPPICSSCKKVRDDNGYWNQIELYIRDHSEADFSHGLCPGCVKELYPDLVFDETTRS
jgi:MASE6 protein